jgi:hypothetical protein
VTKDRLINLKVTILHPFNGHRECQHFEILKLSIVYVILIFYNFCLMLKLYKKCNCQFQIYFFTGKKKFILDLSAVKQSTKIAMDNTT